MLGADGSGAAVGLYSISAKKFARVPGESSQAHGWLFPVWLADGRRLLVRRPDGVAVVNADTGAGRQLFAVAGEMVGRSVGVSRDNRWITYTETSTEATSGSRRSRSHTDPRASSPLAPLSSRPFIVRHAWRDPDPVSKQTLHACSLSQGNIAIVDPAVESYT